MCVSYAWGEGVDVVVGVNHGESAGVAFKFENVPSPSSADAGNVATYSVAGGRPDGNGGGVEVLNDGQTPGGEDEPRENFFFEPRSNGGRLLIELPAPGEIQQVNTYSWHPRGRGPQLFKLYGFEDAGKPLDRASTRAEDLPAAGWKLIAEVDARPKEGEPGGQYGVSVRGANGGALGKFRYVLLDISRTGAEQWFDNTFYSEIDVIDGKEYPAPTKPEAAKPDVLQVAGGYEIEFDTSQVPEIKPWVDETLKPIVAEWYPKIVELLPSDSYRPPQQFGIVFHRDMQGVANTAGRQVNCAADWFLANLEGEAAGAVVHELVHVVQQYGRTRGGSRSPGWLVEGVADHIRWFMYEPQQLRPRVNPDRAHYTDSYRTTAAFLDYVVQNHDADLIKKFNAAMREGKYADGLWRDYTGKSVDELWDEYVAQLRAEAK
jgi:hypothetical protein